MGGFASEATTSHTINPQKNNLKKNPKTAICIKKNCTFANS
jgi:hypothetical protein